MLKTNLYLACLMFATVTAVSAPRADEITDAALSLCEKVKACAMAEMKKEELTAEMRQMMQPMLDSMCANMQARVKSVPSGDALYEPAVACMRSMEALSCKEMQSDKANTPACQTYEKMAREAYDAP